MTTVPQSLPERTTCAIAGGGPAGMMLGYLLARRGVDVVVLEKHADFFRDFRGDTVHPSTLDALETLGLLDDFLKLTKTRQRQLAIRIGSETFPGPDLRFITAHNKFLVFVPQWDFLNFLAERAKALPPFHLALEAEATDLVRDGDRVMGIRVRTGGEERTLTADLVVACDGRHSTLRAASGLPVRDLGAPIDVLWFRVDRRAADPPQTFGSVEPGHFMVLIDRDDYWQCAYVIAKGQLPAMQAAGIDAFHAELLRAAPYLGDRIDAITWDDLKLLTVTVDRLERWALPGLLCIGDAAHAMSPVGGVGINLAVQDAIATSNLLEPVLARSEPVPLDALLAVQRRREFPVKVTQAAQVFVHKRLLQPVLGTSGDASLAGAKRAMRLFGFMRFVIAQFVGVGVRPERPVI